MGASTEGPSEARADRVARTTPVVSDRGRPGRTIRRIQAVGRNLLELYEELGTSTVRRTVAGEWLLDNRHLVLGASAQVATDLTRSFVVSLPKTDPGGRARCEVVACEILRLAGGFVDRDTIERFVGAFQRVSELRIGELWALPAYLRLLVLETLVDEARALLLGGEEEPRGEAVSTAILCLRRLDEEDWKDLVETLSRVDRCLRNLDPAGAYRAMDFVTRDRYRRAVEELADWSGRPEGEVARAAVLEARRRGGGAGHVGELLIGSGRGAFEAALGIRHSPARWFRRLFFRLARPGYFAAIIVLTALLTAAILLPAWGSEASWLVTVLVIVVFVPTSTASVAVVNALATRAISPRALPKMDFGTGVPDEYATCVVVPCLLSEPAEVETLLATVEANYLGNRDPNVRFVVLGDPPDAGEASLPGDQVVLDAAARGVEALNRLHGTAEAEPFLLLYRPRRWNPSEQRWIAWERKRGKLEALNRFLLTGDQGDLIAAVGDPATLRGSAFVITLDADTILPPGVAARLIGTLAHPLNRPVRDDQGRVERGYTVLQPRVETRLPDPSSLFSRIFHRDEGLDLYSHAVSDVYQDLFCEGIYAGKGIYDVGGFHESLEGRVPPNAILSHDLFEGVHGRAGLVTDVAVLEDFPEGPVAYMRRAHRWIRGDWQLLPWLWRRVPSASMGRIPNGLTWLAQWKIFDNMRRSLLSPSLLFLLLLGWFLLPGGVWWWTGWVSGLLAVPVLTPSAVGVMDALRRPAGSRTFRRTRSFRWGLGRWMLGLVFLSWETRVALDAVVRTLFRLRVSHRRLLQWTPAAHASRHRLGEGALAPSIRELRVPASVGVLVTGAALATSLPNPMAWLPLTAAWTVSPLVAWLIARMPSDVRTNRVSSVDENELRLHLRRAWAFFERYAGPDDHWLPPDHVQFDPPVGTAHRTSPTNIGLAMVAALAAYDLGHLSPRRFLARIESTLNTLEQLEKHRGHLLNWYDTRRLTSLPPRYVSTVDSGNLAACLITVAAGIREMTADPIPIERSVRGIADGLEIVGHHLRHVGVDHAGADRLARDIRAWRETDPSVAPPFAEWRHRLIQIEGEAVAPTDPSPTRASETAEMRWWLGVGGRALNVVEAEWGEFRPPSASADRAATILLQEGERCAERLEALARSMDFRFLFDPQRKLFHVGYNADAVSLDVSHYDLYASEARLASYLAIMFGQVGVEHWLMLRRPFRHLARNSALLSWGGSMFEYLLPSLFLRTPSGSLSHRACVRAVRAQIQFGEAAGIPWGVSESAYADTDEGRRYRYRAFGVPSLALHRDSTPRLVVAPYAAGLAFPFEPEQALANLRRQRELGLEGPVGFFDAADFGEGGRAAAPRLVRTVMAHHQGMFIAGIHHLLTGGALVDRFHRSAEARSIEYLLHERAPGIVQATAAARSEAGRPVRPPLAAPVAPWLVSPDRFPPESTVLSNGRLSAFLTAPGGGGLRWEGYDVFRWRPDPTCSSWGEWAYVVDRSDGTVHSVTRAPTWGDTEHEEVVFGESLVEYHRDVGPLRLRTRVTVAPAVDVQIREIGVVNESAETRVVEVSSFAELALARPAEDRRHPAFARLFVECGPDPRNATLWFDRRAEGLDDRPVCVAHRFESVQGEWALVGWHASREELLGRLASLARPRGIVRATLRSPAAGTWAPLDPVASLTMRTTLPPGAEATLAFLTGVGDTRSGVADALETLRSPGSLEVALNHARDRQRQLRQRLGVAPHEARLFQRLIGRLAFPFDRRPDDLPWETEAPSGQELLWSLGVSGDRPVVTVVCRAEATGTPLGELLRALPYLAARNVEFDLVVVGREQDGYGEPIRGWVERTLGELGLGRLLNAPGGVHYVTAGRLPGALDTRLRRASTIFLDEGSETLADLFPEARPPEVELPEFVPVPSSPLEPRPEVPPEPPGDLLFRGPWGGHAPRAGSFITELGGDLPTPAPWSNVLANPGFGTLVNESGGGYTWTRNSGEARLTPFANDPLLDPVGEAIYLRDEETGEVWSPTPRPAGIPPHRVTHRAEETLYSTRSHGLDQRLRVWVPPDGDVKLFEMEVADRWDRPRRVTVTLFVEWVLGTRREVTAPHIRTALDPACDALVASAHFTPGAHPWMGFLASDSPIHGYTCDRHEFLGPRGDRSRPEGLARVGLAQRTGGGLDPCSVLQVHLDIPAGGRTRTRFFLGSASDRDGMARTLAGLRAPRAAVRGRWARRRFWRSIRDSLQVTTPEPAMDLLLNRWLLHQALSSRIWGRTGYYQSSGAIGYRDQLQDSLAFLHQAPDLCRERIADAARHQFAEGDVLHWWHPPEDRGVRTRCSDDRLWLPFVTASYIEATGDVAFLDMEFPYLIGPALEDGENERYDAWTVSGHGSLHDHCMRALERPGILSPRGLPLIGSGDWNDGLNRVGVRGRGESVWLAWFLHDVLSRFAPLCRGRGESSRARTLEDRAEALRAAVEAHAWDGAWYLRGTYDDGSPLGSARNEEGRIDSLPQSWAALSGAGDPDRTREAMEAVWRHLVDREARIVRLLTPPYHHTERNPGYIKSYPPGVRENGGQYTHAAVWTGWAFAALGDGDRAGEIFGILNPVLRPDAAIRDRAYRVEPYVLAGDVYGADPHLGRGGWTWYTGSAAWLYRFGIEGILGLRPVPGGIHVQPCLPSGWPGYSAVRRMGRSQYDIRVENPAGVCSGVRSVTLDGSTLPDARIPLLDDGKRHEAVVTMGDDPGAGGPPPPILRASSVSHPTSP